jgi:uncharacterized protein YicC (UPF0701 family)
MRATIHQAELNAAGTIEKKRADVSEEVDRLRADHAQRLQDEKAESDAPAGV